MGLSSRALLWTVPWLLAGAVLAAPPRDLEPRPPNIRNTTPLNHTVRRWPHLEYRRGRPRVDEDRRPPPPEVAYWYWLEEKEAWEKGLPDAWYLQGTRKSGGLEPQPGNPLGDAWALTNPRHPGVAAPRHLKRNRNARFPKARISPDPGFRTDDPTYRFLPWDRRSDVGRKNRRPRKDCQGLAPWQTLDEQEPPPAPVRPRTSDPGPGEEGAGKLRRMGAALFRRNPDDCRHSCQECHGGFTSLRGIFPRYPAYNGDVNRVIGLEERVNMCRGKYQNRPPLHPESPEMLAVLVHLRELRE